MHRRRFVASSVAGLSFLSGCLQSTIQRTKKLIVENANRSPVTVSVGSRGTFRFEPGTERPVRIEPGTPVKFVWKTDGHNIVVTNQPDGAHWNGHEPIENAGFAAQHIFEVAGVYKFACGPHKAIGATGTILVGDSSLQSRETIVQQSSVSVSVAPGDRFGFVPGSDEPLVISPGTTVTFEWKSDGHNIVVESQPEGAHWKGTKGGAGTLYDTGHTHTHTFEVEGMYRFFCAPHKALYPSATIEVVGG